MAEQTRENRTMFTGKRVVCSYQEVINAPREAVFPLACPSAEYKWIDNWQCEIIYTKSGTNEQGCIFTEEMSSTVLFDAPGATTWITAVYDEQNYQIRFILVGADRAVIQYDIELHDEGGSMTSVLLQFMLTSLCTEVNNMDELVIEKRIMTVATFLTDALKHYCETGEMLKQGSVS